MIRPRALASLTALAALLTLAADAHARQFQMGGTWAMRRGAGFWPLQFADPKMGRPSIHTSAGLLSKARLTPNGPVLGGGVVTATGSAPATLVVPARRFAGAFSTRLPLPGLSLVQITTQLDAAGPAAAATLAAGAGPGSFTWCVENPACVDPPGTTQSLPTPVGRILYRAGANQFGGVMQMLLQGHGSLGGLIDQAPFQVLHFPRAPTAALDSGIQHTGGSYANVVMDYLPHAVATQPLAPPTPSGLITAPGPRVTTMLGVTTAPGLPHPTFHLPFTIATTPMGMKASQLFVHTGFPWTTGTVIVQQTYGSSGDDFFTVRGSDMRTALGAGNIALVAGGVTQRHDFGGRTSYGSFGVVRMTLSPPVPSLSPAGAAAAALLVLLAAGYARRRRGVLPR